MTGDLVKICLIRNVTKLLMALCCVLSVSTGRAETIEGLIIAVADGDTVTLLTDNHTALKIRLEGIDTPEKNQAFGSVAKQNMAELVFKKNVRIVCSKTDRYKRKICRVYVENLDAGLEMLNRGLAWHYKAYEKEQSPQTRRAYSESEELARLEKRGLWVESAPTPPWEFRRNKSARKLDAKGPGGDLTPEVN